jgi:hypothetical protein
VNDVGEIGMVNRLTAEGQHKGFAPVCIDVGGGVTQEFYRVGHFNLSSALGTYLRENY